jgi:hypothetical protein
MHNGNTISRDGQKVLASLAAFVFVSFTVFFIHPFFYTPVNLLPTNIKITDDFGYLAKSIISPVQPLYYAGVFHNEPYFATKRIEVAINFTDLQENVLLLAGIGAQSPNCCKDGLDYGYRADILLTEEGKRYLVARAWETCDQNIACSGFPWQSTMHEDLKPLDIPINSSLEIAIEWAEDARRVDWYYRDLTSINWSKFSSFEPPKIENPYFNVGVIWVGNFFTNWPSGNANFYQIGIATLDEHALNDDGLKVVFECPAVYRNGIKNCISDIDLIEDGDSHWKVLWQWGLPRPDTLIVVNNSKGTIEMTI